MAKLCHQAEWLLGIIINAVALIAKKTPIGNADLFFIISVIIQPSVKRAITATIDGMAIIGGKPQKTIRKRPNPGPIIIKPIEAKNRR